MEWWFGLPLLEHESTPSCPSIRICVLVLGRCVGGQCERITRRRQITDKLPETHRVSLRFGMGNDDESAQSHCAGWSRGW